MPALSDAVPAFDLSGLTPKPAGAGGWLAVQGEHFVDGKGTPVRLFGTNITAEANFPDEADAPRIARRLAQLGVNVVRLHFLDNQWNPSDPTSSLIPASNDLAKDGLSAPALARLDRFIAALKAEGIWINLNLHVGRSYPGHDKTLPDKHKGVDNFMPDMIDGLKLYAKLLLSHTNPHTGLSYKDDPAIAILEISNEDSLLLQPWWITKAPQNVREVLRGQFQEWLKQKYDDKTLAAAWGVDEGATGDDLLTDKPLKKWFVERHHGSEHKVEPLETDGIRWTSTREGRVAWAVQIGSGPMELKAGQRYRVVFSARSDSGSTLALAASESAGSYQNLGLNESCTLGGDWKDFIFHFTPGKVIPEGSRLSFSLLNRTGTVDIRRLTLQPVSSGYLKPGQTLSAGNVPLPEEGSSLPVRRDFFAFLAHTEIAFATGVKKYLKEELGCRQLIAHSQVLFGGIMGARRENMVSDFVDTHGYWQHPWWDAGHDWGREHWHIGNTSQIADPAGGTLSELAMQRVAGKPYSVSEYDIPAPSDYTAELWPMVAAVGSFQDWSAIYHYTFAHSRADYRADRMGNHFNAAGHPAKMAFMPFAAAVFRMGLVEKGTETVTLRAGDDLLLDLTTRLNGSVWSSWRDLWKTKDLTGALAMHRRTALDLSDRSAPLSLHGKPPAKGKDKSATTAAWTWNAEGGIWVLHTPAARAWSGKVGGQEIPAGDAVCKFHDLPAPAPVGTVTIVSLDGKPLAESKKALVTSMRRSENDGPEWNEKRDSVNAKWGDGAAGVIGLRATLTLPGSGWNVTRLDSAGAPKGDAAPLAGGLEISPADGVVWHLLQRP